MTVWAPRGATSRFFGTLQGGVNEGNCVQLDERYEKRTLTEQHMYNDLGCVIGLMFETYTSVDTFCRTTTKQAMDEPKA